MKYQTKRKAPQSNCEALVGAEGVEPPTTLYHLTYCFLDPNIPISDHQLHFGITVFSTSTSTSATSFEDSIGLNEY